MKVSPFDVKKMKTLYKSKAMDNIREFLVPVFNDVANVSPNTSPECFFRFPTAEEVFPKQSLRPVEPTTIPGANKRWAAMKDASYRTAYDVNGIRFGYWVESLVKSDSPVCEKFGTNVYVNSLGVIDFTDIEPDDYIYWRPVFKLKV